MGYAYYTLADGRDAGCGIAAVCDEDGCDEKIDRGLAYLCGDNPHGSEYGCAHYFCDQHLLSPPGSVELMGGGLCKRCNATLRERLAGTICRWCDGWGCTPGPCFKDEAEA